MARNVDVPSCAGCLRYYGGWADKIEGKVVDTTPDTFNYIRKEPVSSMPSCSNSTELTDIGRCLRSDYSLELPPSHVGMEDRPCYRHR